MSGQESDVFLHDVFISHASEDKERLVRPLAHALREAHLDVWYDEFSLKVGDSLRREIDRGLATSQFGIIVLSPAFLAKRWTNYELDGLAQLHAGRSPSRLLPVWHEVDVEDVTRFSPSLANLVAVHTRDGLQAVTTAVLRRLRPAGSTLLHARDELVALGYSPPVVTDDWWLDVAEANSRNDLEGGFQEAMGWGRWGFPLPPRSDDPKARGHRLARAAAQMMWQQAADEQRISQLSHPVDVHRFIDSRPGLEDTAHESPSYLLSYAPLLAIRGFEGQFADVIEDMWEHFGGTKATRPRHFPEYLLLRNPDSCDDPGLVACHFVQGELNGPSTQFYDAIDHVAWLLSSASDWLPEQHRLVLIEGMRQWSQWSSWREYLTGREGQVGILFKALDEKRRDRNYLRRAGREILEARLTDSAEWLGLPESGDELMAALINERFVEAWRTERRNRKP